MPVSATTRARALAQPRSFGRRLCAVGEAARRPSAGTAQRSGAPLVRAHQFQQAHGSARRRYPRWPSSSVDHGQAPSAQQLWDGHNRRPRLTGSASTSKGRARWALTAMGVDQAKHGQARPRGRAAWPHGRIPAPRGRPWHAAPPTRRSGAGRPSYTPGTAAPAPSCTLRLDRSRPRPGYGLTRGGVVAGVFERVSQPLVALGGWPTQVVFEGQSQPGPHLFETDGHTGLFWLRTLPSQAQVSARLQIEPAGEARLGGRPAPSRARAPAGERQCRPQVARPRPGVRPRHRLGDRWRRRRPPRLRGPPGRVPRLPCSSYTPARRRWMSANWSSHRRGWTCAPRRPHARLLRRLRPGRR